MKILSRLSAWALAIGVSVASLSAQFDDLRYRVEGGLTGSRISGFGIPAKDYLLGFRLSGQIILPFEDSNFALQSGLTLSNKGENSRLYINNISKGYSDTQKYTQTQDTDIPFMYLGLPIEVSYRLNLNENNKIYLAVGPTFNYGLSAKIKNLTVGDKSSNYDLFANDVFKRFEIALGGSLMYAYKDIYLKGGIEYGLTTVDGTNRNISPAEGFSVNPFDNDKVRHAQAYISIGYQF